MNRKYEILDPIQDTAGDDWNDMASHSRKTTNELNTGSKSVDRMLQHSEQLMPFSRATSILDNGCGNGSITRSIIQQFGEDIPSSCTFTACDFSPGMIDAVKAKKEEHKDNQHWAGLQTKVADATDMRDIASDSISHLFAGWIYFLTPDPAKCMTESYRMLQSGGVLVVSSWKGNQWLDAMEATKDIRPDIPFPHLPKDWTSTGSVKENFKAAGFEDIVAEEVIVTLVIENREKWVDTMFHTIPLIRKFLSDFSEEERAKARTAAVEKLKQIQPREPGELTGISIVASGRK